MSRPPAITWHPKYVPVQPREEVLLEVLREMNRTFENLGHDATAADYAADIARRLNTAYSVSPGKGSQ